jgi:hypothetical protein
MAPRAAAVPNIKITPKPRFGRLTQKSSYEGGLSETSPPMRATCVNGGHGANAPLPTLRHRGHARASSRQHLPELCQFAASRKTGRRECQVQAAPMARLQQKSRRQSPQVRRNIRHSLRNGLRLMPRSPRCTGLCSHRRPQIIFANLPPASGQHRGDRTTRFCRMHRLRSSSAAHASIASRPTFPDDREASLVRAGRADRGQ